MKHKLTEIWYFTQWLFKRIDWWFVSWWIMIGINIAIWLVPVHIAILFVILDLIYGICVFVYFLIYKPLLNAYAKYKQEQLDLFNTIKNSK